MLYLQYYHYLKIINLEMDNLSYSLFKDKYDSFYLGVFENGQGGWFKGFQITKMNINSRYCYYYDLPAFKSVSKSFYDSLLWILQNTRDEVIDIINRQNRVENNDQNECRFYMIEDKRIYIANPIVSGDSVSFSSITIESDDSIPTMRFDKTGGYIRLLKKALKCYALDDSAYIAIDQKIRQTHRILRTLLMDKYGELSPNTQ